MSACTEVSVGEVDLRPGGRIKRSGSAVSFPRQSQAGSCGRGGPPGNDRVSHRVRHLNVLGDHLVTYTANRRALVHQLTVANLHGEFCTAITGADAAGLLAADAPTLERVQGNE